MRISYSIIVLLFIVHGSICHALGPANGLGAAGSAGATGPTGPAGAGATTISLVNEAVTGTIANKLVKVVGASTATELKHTDGPINAMPIGVCTGGCGTTGSATITIVGLANCVFDGATTVGDMVTSSGSTDGDCTDDGLPPTTNPGGGSTHLDFGIVLSTHGGAGTYQILFGVIMP